MPPIPYPFLLHHHITSSSHPTTTAATILPFPSPPTLPHRLAPISATIPPRAHGMAVYFSNLKSYLLISYVSPPRLGIFTEAIVSSSGSHCSYARAPRDTDSIWFIFSPYFSFSLSLPSSYPPVFLSLFLRLPSASPPSALAFFQSRPTRRAREIARNERPFHLDVLVIVLVCGDSGSNPRHYVNIELTFI